MKILFLTSTLPRFPGDMQANFVGEQAEAWINARSQDEIIILAPHDIDAARSETIERLRIERFRYMSPIGWQRLAYPAMMPNIRRNPLLVLQLPFFLFGEYWAARRIARKTHLSLIYAHWVIPQGFVAWLLKRRLGVPYVLQNHSSDLSVLLKLGKIGKAIARTLLRDADHFFCVNAAQEDFALSLFEGAERDEFRKRCSVLPMGISGLEESAADNCSGGFDIATIGRLSRKKGLNYLIEAAELLAQKGVRPRIAIAGDGEEREALQKLVDKADVSFLGFLAGREKEEFMRTAQRFAFPARASEGDVEGLPVALLEALCRGRPVLASRDTNVEMLPEWPNIRDAVVLVRDPADVAALVEGLERLLDADVVQGTAASHVARYRWTRLIWEYLGPIVSLSRLSNHPAEMLAD